MIPYPIRTTPPPVSRRWVTALAGVMFAALFVQSMPSPLATWALLAVLYCTVEMLGSARLPVAGGPGWPILVGMAVVLEPQGAVLGAGLAIAAAAILDSIRAQTLRPGGDRFLAHLPPVVVAVVAIGFSGDAGPLLITVAGLLAGAAAHVLGRQIIAGLTWDIPWVGRAIEPRTLIQSMGIGAAAALLGRVLAVGAGIVAPLVIVGLVAVVALELGDRRVAEARRATVRSLLMALEAKDLYTRGHAVRVGELCAVIADEMDLSPQRTEQLVTAALLHDLGKIATPRHLLRKPGRLTAEEYHRVQEHASVTAGLLAGIDFLRPVVPVVAEHHAYVDGGGYGRKAVDGPSLEARIVAVADAFDAMTSHRPYRRALHRRYAFDELRRGAGTQFDGEVVEALIRRVEARGEVAVISGATTDAEARSLAEMAATS